MALTVTSRGTGTHNTGATTLVPGGRTATLAVGSRGVLCMALDNAGSGGATVAAPDTWTDAKGNVWTRVPGASGLYDNGAASAGIEQVVYTAPITTALLTTDLGTITWAGGVSPVAKAWTWYEVIPSNGVMPIVFNSGIIAGATAANATVTTASVLVGDAVIGVYAAENVAAVTGDSDSTNGSWTAQQTATVGSTTSGVRIASQQKVQTTAASTQSYDVTVASQDRIAGYVMFHEVIPVTVTPGVAALTLAAQIPTVTAPDNQVSTPGVASLALAPQTPVVSASAHQTATPGVAALALSPLAPTVTASDHRLVTPGTASFALSPQTPTVAASDHQVATPGAAALTLTAQAPAADVSANQSALPGTAALVLTGQVPSVELPIGATPGAAALTLTASAPDTVLSDHQLVTPNLASLVLSPQIPTAQVSDNRLATPGVAGLLLEPKVPAVTIDSAATITPGPAALALTAFAPDAIASDHRVVEPGPALLALSAFAPTVSTGAPAIGLPEQVTAMTVIDADRRVAATLDDSPLVALAWPEYESSVVLS